MATLLSFTLANGKRLDALSYRMDTSLDAAVQRPAVNVLTALGWTRVLWADVASVTAKMGRPT